MKQIEQILPRNIENESLKKILNIYSDAIDEYVNIGTHIISWLLHKKDGKDSDLIFALILRRFIELADSISIVLRSSSIEPAKIILRSLFEMTFYIEYILMNDKERKSIIFLLNENWEEKSLLNDILNNYKKNNNEHIKQLIKKRIKEIDNTLKEHGEIIKEYNKIKKQIKRRPKWYMLFNGPKNIRELARYIKREELYNMFYREFSKTTHGTDIIKGKFILNKNVPSIIQIRNPEDAKEVVSWTLRLLLLIYEKFIEKVVPEKGVLLKNWYYNEGKKYSDSVNRTKINFKKQ